MRPLVVDSFAGGGGASTGIEMALGRSPDIAINHNAVALAMHLANHPDARHLSKNIWQVDPLEAVGNRPVGLAWFSPDCKHFSKAKGGKPVKRNIRDLAWTVVLWAKRARPAVIILENVEEFQTWGPLIENEKGDFVPDPARRGETFKLWVADLKRCGYKVEGRELVAADYGAPTTRKRFFLIARRDGLPIVWPAPTHGKPSDPDVVAGRKLPWRSAAEIIDWSLPCPSIFETSAEIMAKHGVRAVRPLAEATMARVARGTKRYVLDAAEPYIVKFQSGSTGSPIDAPLPTVTANSFHKRPGGAAPVGLVVPSVIRADMHSAAARNGVHGPEEPLRTVTTNNPFAIVAPSLMPLTHQGGDRNNTVEEPVRTITTAHRGEMAMIAPVLTAAQHGGSLRGADEPMRTIAASDKDQHAIIAPTLVQTGYGERDGQTPRSLDIGKPLGTVVAGGAKQALVANFLAQHNTGVVGHDAREPLSTIVLKGCTQGVVAAHLQNMRGSDRRDAPVAEPARTVTAGGGHAALVSAFIEKYYGAGIGQPVDDPFATVTTRDRFGLVTVDVAGEPYVITDIGLRMLTPRELFLAQGFPPEYQIDGIVLDGRVLTKSDQISCVGNSVCPPLAAALVAANCAHLAVEPMMEAAE
ncbi:DNA cytosine methyltransferase [Aurantimonas endophytica]|nr:DNA cytosine methyltransferase [Aurantimonas endophytica]MCO6405293.1 C-5 cytosine-specific DNA methylase [Aurantimonas endophytica]